MMPSPSTVDLDRELHTRGYRLTPARQAIWDALRTAHIHLTASEVAEATAEAGRPVGLASVYRTLDLLEELGLARRSRLGEDDADRWEVVHLDDRFHVSCTRCGWVDHHEGELVALVERHLTEQHGFEVHWVELHVTGVCSGCAHTRPSP